MITHQLILIFGLIISGYIFNKVHILDSFSNEKLSKFLVNAAIPATIIASASSQSGGSGSTVVWFFAIAIGYFLLMPFICMLLVRIMKKDKSYQLMLLYSNLGFMGIPIISSIYGEESVFYVTIFMMIFNVSLFSYGVYVLNSTKQGSTTFDMKKLLNPGVTCALAGLMIFLFKITLPYDLTQLLKSIGSVTTPLAMIVIGSSLAEIPLKSVFADKSMYILAFMKLFVIPAALWAVLEMIVHDEMIIKICVILSSLPTAGNVSMLYSEYGGDLTSVSKGICISTLFSVLAIPLWLMILS